MGKLYEALTEYGQSKAYAFHMPGHKRQEQVTENPYQIDLTEIPGFDDLHASTGILRELKERIASLYHCDRAEISLNGSTGGLLTLISAATSYGDEIAVARNCHKAVYHAMELRGLKPYYIYPRTLLGAAGKMGINGAIEPSDVEKLLKEHPSIRVVVITSPTYDGICSDVSAIAQIAHAHSIPLIVDAAHGAHLGFSELFPKNPLQLGADAVVLSIHKTLPALTMTSVFCWKGKRISEDAIEHFFDVFCSSSPSYPLLCSVESAMDVLESETIGQKMAAWKDRLDRFYEGTANLKNLVVLIPEKESEFTVDASKILIGVRPGRYYAGWTDEAENGRTGSGKENAGNVWADKENAGNVWTGKEENGEVGSDKENAKRAETDKKESGKREIDLEKIIGGPELEEILRTKYNLQMEMAAGQYVLALTSLCDTDEGFDRLREALHRIDENLTEGNAEAAGCESKESLATDSESEKVLATDRESEESLATDSEFEKVLATDSESEKVLATDRESEKVLATENEFKKILATELPTARVKYDFAEMEEKKKSGVTCVAAEESLGKVSADYVLVYPPGIPLLAPGEVVTEEVLEKIKDCRERGLNLIGLSEGSLPVL